VTGYAVKEIFLTLQGEGAHAGRAAVFCRFSGCNLWSGREADREFAACTFCDTDFVGMDGTRGGRYQTAASLADAMLDEWPAGVGDRFCVLTGGEPLLQVDEDLVGVLRKRHFEIAVETNGTIEPPPGIDWLCVSPKSTVELKVRRGQELKLVFPQADAPPDRFADLPFDRFSLQPMDAGSRTSENLQLAIAYCLAHPKWRLSLQTHKTTGIR
jgi:7-carboxy-7-deazaguanine synthase